MPTPEARLATILDHATAADPCGVLLYFHTPAEAEAFLADYTRFAARRGAEADRLVRLFARVIVEGDGAFTGEAWEAALCEAERINRGAPSQTGGGDADRRLLEAAIRLCEGLGGAEHDARLSKLAETYGQWRIEGPQTGGGDAGEPQDFRELPSRVIAALETGGGDAGERARDYMQQALEIIHASNEWSGTPPDLPYREHLQRGIAAALRSSRREGAEAMRDTCKAVAVKRRDFDRQMQSSGWKVGGQTPADGIIAGIEALPIPGKTE